MVTISAHPGSFIWIPKPFNLNFLAFWCMFCECFCARHIYCTENPTLTLGSGAWGSLYIKLLFPSVISCYCITKSPTLVVYRAAFLATCQTLAFEAVAIVAFAGDVFRAAILANFVIGGHVPHYCMYCMFCTLRQVCLPTSCR